ncbi:MAG TPA: VOC family protein [Chitinophagaceae bacterium]|nr:VOC family protein [Chitinophagaceae bacterium]
MKIDHLAIWVHDLERVRTFYETYFQAQAGPPYHNPKTHFRSYFLQFRDGCRLELMQRPDVEEPAGRPGGQYFGIAHFALSAGSREAVDTLTERLRRDGYAVAGEPRTTGDGYYESVILDPENNRIEITI